MQTSNTFASNSLTQADDGSSSPRRLEDIVYQCVTIAAILLILGSIWIF